MSSRRHRLATTICISVLAMSFFCADAAAACTPVFATLSIAGKQYTVHLGQTPPPSVVAGLVSLNVQFRDTYEKKYSISGVSVRYTLDDQPIGPVLTDNFSWSWDSTTATEGTHVLSVLYVNEPPPSGSPCYTFSPHEYSVVVENTGVPITGAQMVPIAAPTTLATVGPIPPQKADWVTYPGFQPHATAHPYNYVAVPPAGGVPPAGAPAEESGADPEGGVVDAADGAASP